MSLHIPDEWITAEVTAGHGHYIPGGVMLTYQGVQGVAGRAVATELRAWCESPDALAYTDELDPPRSNK